MEEVVILGLRSKSKLCIPIIEALDYKKEAICRGIKANIERIKVFPYYVPTTLIKSHNDDEYVLLKAYLDISKEEYRGLKAGDISRCVLSNKDIEIIKVLDNKYKYILEEIYKNPKEKNNLIYNATQWVQILGFSNKEEFNDYLKLIDMKIQAKKFTINFSINKSTISYLRCFLKKYYKLKDGLDIKFNFDYINIKDKLDEEDIEYKKMVEDLNSEEVMFLFENIIFNKKNKPSKSFFKKYVYNNLNIKSLNFDSLNNIFIFESLLDDEEYAYNCGFDFDDYFKYIADKNFNHLYREAAQVKIKLYPEYNNLSIYNEYDVIEKEFSSAYKILPYISDKSYNILDKIPLLYIEDRKKHFNSNFISKYLKRRIK